MQHKWYRLHARAFAWKHIWSEETLALLLVLFIFISPASAIIRFTERSLFMQNTEPGATTSYTLRFQYTTPAAVGSVDMRFCMDPIPYHPCITPPGLDISNAVLSDQTGETGFTIGSISTMAEDLSGPGNPADPPNHIILTRTPSVITSAVTSTYKFDNIVNPSAVGKGQAFSIRLMSLASTDGTGPQIDVGSVRGQTTNSIVIETQVPPILIFCLAEQVADQCAGTNNNYYSDMGELSAESTLTAQSQMAVGTNATGGFAIVVNGSPPAAGTNVIDSPSTPTASTKGVNQFGINLVQNTLPAVGSDPDGPFANAIPSPDYSVPDRYKFVSGDVLAYSANVSLMKKFTVSYILNSREDLRAGVYTTTLTFTASGRF